MASRTTLNAANLKALGAERLAGLLIEISTGDAAAKRKLRLALAGAQSPKDAAREVTKRLTSIARARTFVTWRNRKKLVDDLETQRRAIVDQIAPADPDEALDLIWRFLALADPVFERCDDSSGTVIGIFHRALSDLADIATKAGADPKITADRVFAALQDNGYGQYDGIITLLTPVLGETGLAHLEQRVREYGREEIKVPPPEERRAVAYGLNITIYADEMRARQRDSMVRMALMEIADARGDVDALIAQYDAETRAVPQIAAEIATRLLEDERPEEALGFIEAAQHEDGRFVPEAWHVARIATLDALGRRDEAQAVRWELFARELSAEFLRAYLKNLPDFDDIEAEHKAMDHAAAHENPLVALHFFLKWPAPDRAAALLIAQREKINGDHYEILTPAAETLRDAHPLAATIALRAMIDFTLTQARSSRYGHAARHLSTCADLAGQIADFEVIEDHEIYLARLKREHGRKHGFWARVLES
jgi:hypothetical protein